MASNVQTHRQNLLPSHSHEQRDFETSTALGDGVPRQSQHKAPCMAQPGSCRAAGSQKDGQHEGQDIIREVSECPVPEANMQENITTGWGTDQHSPASQQHIYAS